MAYNLNALAVALGLSGKAQEAEQAHRRDLEVVRRVYGPDNMNVAMILSNIADCLNIQGHHGEAEATARKALAGFNKAMGPNHPRRADILQTLGDALYGAGRTAAAGEEFRDRYEICRRAFGENNIRTIRASIRLAEWEGRFGSATSSLTRVEFNEKQVIKTDREQTIDGGMNKRAEGHARAALRDFAGAKRALNESRDILTPTLSMNHCQTRATIRALAAMP